MSQKYSVITPQSFILHHPAPENFQIIPIEINNTLPTVLQVSETVQEDSIWNGLHYRRRIGLNRQTYRNVAIYAVFSVL